MEASQTLERSMGKREQANCKKEVDFKREIRSRYLKLRDQIPEDVRREKSQRIMEKLMAHLWYDEAEDLLCFVNFRSEVDTVTLMQESLRSGKNVYCPRVAADKRTMEFYQIRSTEELQSGYQGILEPPAEETRRFEPSQSGGKQPETVVCEKPECPALMILPGAAFDPHCHRIGYGGGFYDRYLERFSIPIHTIAVAFDEQVAPEIPSEFHDICPELVITDRQVIERKAGRCRIR